MNIQILHLLDGARNAKGLTVIIDVFRAFSTACYAFEAGASRIIPVALIDEAFSLKEQHADYLLMGERNEIKPPGFDYGNSPSQLPAGGLIGKTIVHTTSSGTQGIAAANNASEIITGSFVNAGAIIDYILSRKPADVSLVCMGYACEYPTDEDTLCAEYIYSRLKGNPADMAAMTEIIRQGSGKRFFDPSKQNWAPSEDFDLCLNLDKFNFILQVAQDGIEKYLKKIEPPFIINQNQHLNYQMKKYNFNELVQREGTNSIKYDARERYFKSNDVLPLWVADTDFKTPDFIVDAIKKRASHEIYGYTFKPDSFYEAVIGWMKRRHDWDIKQEWISSSPGVVAGLTIAVEAFSKPGDGVIVQPPVYFPFFETVKGTNRKLVENPLKLVNNRYTFDFEDLQSKITPDTRLLLLCNPQNPGGMVWTLEELQRLSKICLENNIILISDEIHSDLVFKPNRHIPYATISEEAALNSVICMAPSKTFNVAGLASSLVIIPDKKLFARYERVLNVSHLGMGNLFGSVALEAAYTSGDEWLDQLMDYLGENYRMLEDYFHTHLPRVKVMKPEATYLIWLDFRDYGMNDRQLLKFITEKAGVGLNNGARFGTGGDGWMRLNIGCPANVLHEGLERLKNAFVNL